MLSTLGRLKDWAASLPVPQPVLLGIVGLACFLGTCLVLRKPLTWGWALVPGVLLAIAIEAWEVWDHYGAVGFGNTSLLGVVLRHLIDVALLNLPAAILVVIARRFAARG